MFVSGKPMMLKQCIFLGRSAAHCEKKTYEKDVPLDSYQYFVGVCHVKHGKLLLCVQVLF